MKTTLMPLSVCILCATSAVSGEFRPAAHGTNAGKAAEIAGKAAVGVAKSAENVSLPKIGNQAEFVSFFRSLSVTAQYGKVEEVGPALDANGAEKKSFVFKGFVFRSDDRGPGHKTMKRGFTSRNDLSVPANRTEAMGLGRLHAVTGKFRGAAEPDFRNIRNIRRNRKIRRRGGMRMAAKIPLLPSCAKGADLAQ